MQSQRKIASNTVTSKQFIKTRVIPLSIQLNSKLGILNFTSEDSHTKLQKVQTELLHHKEVISYKNTIHGSQSQESDQDTMVRKKQIFTDIITIKPQNLKKKFFKVQIPISKAGSLKNRQKKQKEHFIIQFSIDKGTLTIVNDIFDAKTQINRQTTAQNNLTFQDKMKLQNAKLDNRRREEKIQVLTDKKKK